MSWFKRSIKGILTPTVNKKNIPTGLWIKTPKGKIVYTKDLKENSFVSPEDGYHIKIGSKEYFEILFDSNKFEEIDQNLESKDPLNFKDAKSYKDRLSAAQKKTHLKDAIRVGHGKMNDLAIVIASMDFSFIGGSMGSVVGQKIANAIDYSLKNKMPLLIISQSGGARMMEAGYSLMQMAKTSAKLYQLSKANIPYISLLTNPTFGGITASYAMLGDFNIAEPGAIIGFAGPRVIRETIGKELPKGFQTSESLLENGFLDFIIDRRELKSKLTTLLNLIIEKK
ncbi:MAG: acetyl-CoA carboxylase carboxyltransferase subunit beta [Bacteroidetes bacterium]|nr:acetyl-CoA carboxylase carboxyltransferase subunit beta [Bacteroidota bacterium]